VINANAISIGRFVLPDTRFLTGETPEAFEVYVSDFAAISANRQALNANIEALRVLVERLSAAGYEVTEYYDHRMLQRVWAFRRQNNDLSGRR
jgi:hypothetical protein